MIPGLLLEHVHVVIDGTAFKLWGAIICCGRCNVKVMCSRI